MKILNRYVTYLFLLVMALQFTSCDTEEDDSDDDTNNNTSSFVGVWTRELGPSGDETDLAIGLIEGDATRVYMCEKVGSTAAGFYKGYLVDNTIVWDDVHGLPNTSLRMVDSKLEFHYASVQGSLPTLYSSGSWSAECGALTLSNTGGNDGGNTGGNGGGTGGTATTGEATVWVQSDLGCGNISVEVNGVGGTITSFYTMDPGCNSSGSANFDLPGGTYTINASCQGFTWNGTITVTNGECITLQLT